MRDEKEGRKKQARSNKQQGKATRQSNTAHPSQPFPRKMSCFRCIDILYTQVQCTCTCTHLAVLNIIHAIQSNLFQLVRLYPELNAHLSPLCHLTDDHRNVTHRQRLSYSEQDTCTISSVDAINYDIIATSEKRVDQCEGRADSLVKCFMKLVKMI